MGRWRKKNYYKQKRQSQPTDKKDGGSWDGDVEAASTSSVGIPGWTYKERRELIRYLEKYKKECERVHGGILPNPQRRPVTVGMIQLPLLTSGVLQRACLALPSTLTAKNRKMVHECCAEVSLFHITAGERHDRENRVLWISCYYDGFDAVPNIDPFYRSEENTKILSHRLDSDDVKYFHPAIHQFRPWYVRQNRPWNATPLGKKNEANNGNHQRIYSDVDDGKKLIDPLIDEPEQCLREEKDTMDFDYWDKKDLSDICPPAECPEGDDHQPSTWSLVDSPAKMHACVQALQASEISEIGFDIEAFNPSKYVQLTCLLQITTNVGHEYVIDPLAPGVWDLIGPGLGPFFADPGIVKIGHSIGGLDVRSLHRDFGIFVVNAFDTYECAQVLRLEQHGLAAVCEYYGLNESDHYKDLKAHYQACDWRLRPLTKPMLEYGRYDVHYLVRLRWLMIRDLTRKELYDEISEEAKEEARQAASIMNDALAHFRDEDEDEGWALPSNDIVSNLNEDHHDVEGTVADDTEQAVQDDGKVDAALLRMQPNLMKVLARSQYRCMDLWSGKKEPHENHPMYESIKFRARANLIVWSEEHKALYDKLLEWRDHVAASMEILPGFVAPLEFLIPIALQQPTSEKALKRVSYHLPEVIQENDTCRASLLELVRSHQTSASQSILEYKTRATTLVSSRRRRKQRNKPQPLELGLGLGPDLGVGWSTTALLFMAAAGTALLSYSRWRHRN